MKQNKWTILISFPLTVATLVGAWYLDAGEQGFWSNVLLGVFGSGFLTLVIAIVNYLTERRRTLESFGTLGLKAARAFNKYPIDGTAEEKIEAILLINEVDFTGFGDAYAAIDFLFGNKKSRKKIYSEIYKPVQETRDTITESAFDIVRLRRAIPGNPALLEPYISNVDNKLIKTEVSYVEYEDGHKVEVKNISNRMTCMIYEKYNGFYRKLMYPLEKREEKVE